MHTFAEAERLFAADRINELTLDGAGVRFLKLRSMARKEYLERLLMEAGLGYAGLAADDLLEHVFESAVTAAQIEGTIRAIYLEEREARRVVEAELVSELYRMETFDWGGLHQNSLEKTIVDNYVKKIRSFDRLTECIDNELQASLRGYVRCSWYNHWTSIIIEDVFRDHPAVLPAVGLVKKIDFFVSGVPFDLKVTHLPEGYVKDRRRTAGLRPEITLLKRACRGLGIRFVAEEMSDSELLEDMWKKVRDHPSDCARDVVSELREFRIALVREALADSGELVRWLYENQGVRRFDASNRLFLVLIDTDNFFDSWKLKRARPLLVERIHNALDHSAGRLGSEVLFNWEGETHRAQSAAIVVAHGRLPE